ncbi:MAG: fumarylacetoacetate hydrolase family protein [Mycobacterium sp.]
MKLTTCEAAGLHLPGIVVDDEIADLSAVDGAPTSILSLLQQPDWPERARDLFTRAPRRSLAEVALAAPVPKLAKYLAIGLNARDHRREGNARWLLREPRLIAVAAGYLLAHPKPKYPYFFAKATSSIIGPYDPIVLPRAATKVDWEGELALVIGDPVYDVDTATAARGIAGYLIANDGSVRDWQLDNPTTTALAKSSPTHGPLGPWLVTADEIDPADLELRTYLNGELRQHDQIADLILSPAEIVASLSRFCLLEAGDVIACGTFAGTGWPAGRFLRPGGTVRVPVVAQRDLHRRPHPSRAPVMTPIDAQPAPEALLASHHARQAATTRSRVSRRFPGGAMTTPNTGEQPAKYGDIITAAQELFGEVGYDKTGVREIAERAHIAIGTLYSYFADGKIGVLTAALNERVERLITFVLGTEETDPVEAFLDRARRLNSEVVRDPFLRRLFIDQDRVTEPRLRERGQQIVDLFGTEAVAELNRLVDAGLAQCADPEAVAVLLRVANVGWIATQRSGAHSVDHARFTDTVIASVRALLRAQH